MIDARRVNEILKDCLYKEEELEISDKAPDDAILVDGIIMKFAFHPGRVESLKEEIEGFISQLSDKIKNGMSFLEMCVTKDGKSWGQHINCEELLVLGMAIKRMDYCAPRSMWSILPGGMPYIIVKGDESNGKGQGYQEGNKEET